MGLKHTDDTKSRDIFENSNNLWVPVIEEIGNEQTMISCFTTTLEVVKIILIREYLN